MNFAEFILKMRDFDIIEYALNHSNSNNFTMNIKPYLMALNQNFNVDFISNFMHYLPNNQFLMI